MTRNKRVSIALEVTPSGYILDIMIDGAGRYDKERYAFQHLDDALSQAQKAANEVLGDRMIAIKEITVDDFYGKG